MKLLITDLDNTLYDWVTYFAHSFSAMVTRLSLLLGTPVDQLLEEFKVVHQKYENSEQPFAVFEIASVQRRFGRLDRAALKQELDEALHEFNRARREHLHLYPGVMSTLEELRRRGVCVVGHTESIAANAYYRLQYLKISEFFTRLFALEGKVLPHPSPERELLLVPPGDLLHIVPRAERKPNPGLLLDICARQGVNPAEAVYVGDSLTRDVSMAKAAGVRAVWAEYGVKYDRQLWAILVRVTHWSPTDVRREEELRQAFAATTPDVTIQSFSELLGI
jgi:phosphoglycolate phosphatase-like HAD superfamily hydrolase